jgi:hypothetical protein
LLFVVAGLALALLTGRLTPHLVPDSASYLNYSFSSLEEICRSARMPGYPLWLLIWKRTIGIEIVPAAQVIVHATAAWWLLCELKQWEMPRGQRLAAAIAVGVGCTAMDHISTISTDAIAASFGVMVATAMLRSVRLRNRRWSWVPVAVLATVAIFIRPAYLFLIPWLLIGGAMLERIGGISWRSALISGFRLSAIVVLPLVAWMCVRFAVVGDFAILPFGHQNLAGILVQLVSDDELRGLRGEPARLAGGIVDRKHEFEADHGFAEGDPGATMTIDARWDDMTYNVVVRAAREITGDDTVMQNLAIARLNKAIIRRWPVRYAIWLLKAVRRGAWAIAADMVMHPLFLAAIGCAILCILYRSVTGSSGQLVLEDSPAPRALSIVAWTYMITKLGLVILTSPPIGRFSDAAAIFIPAWFAAAFLRWWQREA